MRIAIVQSSIDGKWGYCPDAARALLRLEYSEDSPCATPEEAERWARADASIPRPIQFTRYPTELHPGVTP